MVRQTGKSSERFKVLVWLGLESAAARALARGVLRYAATHRHLDLHIWNQHAPRGEFTDWDDWRPDGIAAGDAGIARPMPTSVRAAVVFHWTGGDARSSLQRRDSFATKCVPLNATGPWPDAKLRQNRCGYDAARGGYATIAFAASSINLHARI
ncbi:MAG: hypothetical protein ILM98_02800, partial [Kiritimatiellae bacterium]|nr:hypothetical protein [Kiritimatiellia bacterium]